MEFQQSRSGSSNVYVGIEHNLLDAVDPVLMSASARLEKIYRETFWAIPAAFEFGQACLALAKRGLNINPITLYLGPGGVGLSKYTSHLEAMLGEHNHCMFDPNIFYTDDELRKQVPRMAGHMVYTLVLHENVQDLFFLRFRFYFFCTFSFLPQGQHPQRFLYVFGVALRFVLRFLYVFVYRRRSICERLLYVSVNVFFLRFRVMDGAQNLPRRKRPNKKTP